MSTAGHFWANGDRTETLPWCWNHIAQDVAASAGNTLDQNARLFALLNMAMADAATAASDAKYVYDLCVPVTSIRAGDSDVDALTAAGHVAVSGLRLRPQHL